MNLTQAYWPSPPDVSRYGCLSTWGVWLTTRDDEVKLPAAPSGSSADNSTYDDCFD